MLQLIFFIVCILCSIVLVLTFKYDLRFDKTIDLEHYWLFGFSNRITSIVKLTIMHFALASIVAICIIFAWSLIAPNAATTIIPELRWDKIMVHDLFWIISIFLALSIASINAFSCLSRPIWDVFISYNTKNIDIVRPVAEQLIRSGRRVWFAEYQVLLGNYNSFEKAVNFGLKNCRMGIVFTNNMYVDSEYCKLEIEQLLKRCGPENILEIMSPKEDRPHQIYPALMKCSIFSGKDLYGILDFISKITEWPIKITLPIIKSTPKPYKAVCLGRPFLLDIKDWELTNKGEIDSKKSTRGLEFKYKHLMDSCQLVVNLYCGEEISIEGQRINQSKDDRQMYKHLMEYAGNYLSKINGKVRGLHLFHHAGLSQIALTYCTDYYWARKYSISIPNQSTKKMAEFVFTFALIDSTYSPVHFYENAHLMDRFVKSLKWI